MCNVSQGIKEKAFSQGISQGLSQGIAQGKLDAILELLREGVISLSTAAEKLNLTQDELSKMIN